MQLRTKEIEVLSGLLSIAYENRDLPEHILWKIVFDYDSRIRVRYSIRNKYNEPLGEASFNNILTDLRKKGIIVDNTISNKYWFVPKDTFTLTVNFNIDEQ